MMSSNKHLRQWTRVPGDGSPVRVTLPSGSEVTGRLHDESFGGAGLVFEQAPPLKEGDAVIVDFHGTDLPSVVRCCLLTDRGMRIGLQFRESKRSVKPVLRSASELRRERQAAAAMAKSPPAPRRDISDDSAQAEFLKEVPSGLFKLSALFESGNWQPLKNTLKQLADHARAVELHDIALAVSPLLQGLNDCAPKATLAPRMENLVDCCLCAAEAA